MSKTCLTLSLPFLPLLPQAFHLIRLNSQLWRISFFFSLLTHFSRRCVHNKTTLFLFVASLLHTLILLPSSPAPSSPRLALMFSVFNHRSTALFALSLLLVSPAARGCAQRELHYGGLPVNSRTLNTPLWESDRQKILTTGRVLKPCVTTLRTTITKHTLLFTNVTTTARDHDESFTPRTKLGWRCARWTLKKSPTTTTTFRTDESKIKRN